MATNSLQALGSQNVGKNVNHGTFLESACDAVPHEVRTVLRVDCISWRMPSARFLGTLFGEFVPLQLQAHRGFPVQHT